MESSPSRNPLLSREDISSAEEEGDESLDENMQATIVERNNYIATSQSSSSYSHKDRRRNQAAPVDRYNFTYIVFYVLGM